MAGELNLYGIFVPTLLLQALVAYVLFSLLGKWIDRLQAKDWILFPPIFNLCLYIIILGLVFVISSYLFN